MTTWRLLLGDVRETLATLPDASVQCCVTSPPYWGLRDYGTATWAGGDSACDHIAPATGPTQNKGNNGKFGAPYRDVCGKCGAKRIDSQIGLEPTPDAYVANMVQVFREVRRVLRDDGTLWLNLGSSYASGDTAASQSRHDPRARACGTDGSTLQDSTVAGSACSDLCDGCLADWLTHRDHIVGIAQPQRQDVPLPWQTGRDSGPMGSASTSPDASLLGVQASNTLESWLQHRGECSRCASRASALASTRPSSAGVPEFGCMAWLNYTSRLKQKDLVPIPWLVAMALQADGWYLRSDIIWSKPNPMPESVQDRPTKAHEYIFLLTKNARYYYDAAAIREPYAPSTLTQFDTAYEGHATKKYAGTGAQNPSDVKRRIVDKQRGHGRRHAGFNDRWDAMEKHEQVAGGANKRSVWTVATQPYPEAHFATYPEALIEPCIKAGSRPGDTVLDPFTGSGTTGVVAVRHQRHFVGVELNPAYVALARQRIGSVAPLLATEVERGAINTP